MYVIVAGCGRVGAILAEGLSYERHDVVVVDKDASAFRRLGSAFNGITIEGVAFDEEVLLDAGIEQADAFAAVTNYDNTNLMASEVASGIYGVPTVLSRLYNPDKELTFFKMGIDYVCSTTLIADRMRERLFHSDHVSIQQDRLDVGLQVVEFVVEGPAAAHTLGELNYGVSSQVITLLRGNKEIDWTESTALEPGDRLIVTLRREGWRTVRACLGADYVARKHCPADLLQDEGLTDAVYYREPERPKVVIGGCSMVGAHLGFLFSMEGSEVTIIDEEPTKFRRLPDQFKGRTLEGVAFDVDTLVEAGIESADAFVAVTKFDNKNLMAAEVARHLFGVPHVMARMFNPDKEPTYQALNMPFVCGTRLIAHSIMERMLKPMVAVKASCSLNRFDLVEFACPAAWDAKTIFDAEKASGLRFAYVARRSSGFLPTHNFVLRPGDSVTALATEKSRERLEKFLHR